MVWGTDLEMLILYILEIGFAEMYELPQTCLAYASHFKQFDENCQTFIKASAVSSCDTMWHARLHSMNCEVDFGWITMSLWVCFGSMWPLCHVQFCDSTEWLLGINLLCSVNSAKFG